LINQFLGFFVAAPLPPTISYECKRGAKPVAFRSTRSRVMMLTSPPY
jgi:hypothetical protein